MVTWFCTATQYKSKTNFSLEAVVCKNLDFICDEMRIRGEDRHIKCQQLRRQTEVWLWTGSATRCGFREMMTWRKDMQGEDELLEARKQGRRNYEWLKHIKEKEKRQLENQRAEWCQRKTKVTTTKKIRRRFAASQSWSSSTSDDAL